jgi:membrane peptidoglycan carboxypeptidase
MDPSADEPTAAKQTADSPDSSPTPSDSSAAETRSHSPVAPSDLPADQPCSPPETPAVVADPRAARPVADVIESGIPVRPAVKRSRRAFIALAVVLALIGAGLGAAGYYYRSVGFATLVDSGGSSTVYYSDGTVLAHLGQRRAIQLSYVEFSEAVTNAAVAAMDPGFWSDTGGALTRAVVRIGLELQDSSNSGKARVWVAARKLDDKLSKNQILEYFLNAVPLGRNTFGVEAAAQVYFGKTARRGASPAVALTSSEAIALMSMVDAPADFDIGGSATAVANSQHRWGEIRDAMTSNGWLTRSAAASLSYPTTVKPETADTWPTGANTPAGLVVPQVLAEMATMHPFKGTSWAKLENSNLSIYTTLASPAQRLLEHAADRSQPGALMFGQPDAIQAAAAVVEPGTGRVLAYYGGDGTGADYADSYVGEDGKRVGFGAHPPGGVFGVHVLAAALKSGVSVMSRWPATSVDMPGRTGDFQVRNSSACATPCTLAAATTASVDTAMYAVGLSVGPNKVIEAARDAGVSALYSSSGRVDLPPGQLTPLVPQKFDSDVSLGTYPITVLDEATAMATYARGGVAVRPHFVLKVMIEHQIVASEILPPPNQKPILTQGAAADLTWTLSQNPAGKLTNGWDSAVKTGEFSPRPDGAPTDAWTAGYTTRLAIAVWIGNRKDPAPLRNNQGELVLGSGLPAQIYRAFMNTAPNTLNLDHTTADSFQPPAFVGDEHPAGSTG